MNIMKAARADRRGILRKKKPVLMGGAIQRFGIFEVGGKQYEVYHRGRDAPFTIKRRISINGKPVSAPLSASELTRVRKALIKRGVLL